MNNVAKNFNILVTNLSVLHNYFNSLLCLKDILKPFKKYPSRASSTIYGIRSKSKKLTNHSRLFFSHSTVIGQFVTFTISITTATAIVDQA